MANYEVTNETYQRYTAQVNIRDERYLAKMESIITFFTLCAFRNEKAVKDYARDLYLFYWKVFLAN